MKSGRGGCDPLPGPTFHRLDPFIIPMGSAPATNATGMLFLTLAAAAAFLVHRAHEALPRTDAMVQNSRLHPNPVRAASEAKPTQAAAHLNATPEFRSAAGSPDGRSPGSGTVLPSSPHGGKPHAGPELSAARLQSHPNPARRSSVGNGLVAEPVNPDSESTLLSDGTRDSTAVTGAGTGIEVPASPPADPVASVAALTDLTDFTPVERSVVLSLADSFSESLAPPAETAAAGEESQASFRELSVEAHDDHLRLALGWEAFNRLSAVSSGLRTRPAHP